MKTNKIYWKNIDQLDLNNHEINNIHENEFVSKLPVDHNKNGDELDNSHSRRDFLKYLGFEQGLYSIIYYFFLFSLESIYLLSNLKQLQQKLLRQQGVFLYKHTTFP